MVLFCVWSLSAIFSHLNLLHSPCPSHEYLPAVPILQSSLLLLISKLMFKGISWCIPAANILCFDLFSPFHYSPLLFLSHSPLFKSFQKKCLLVSHMYVFLRINATKIVITKFLVENNIGYRVKIPMFLSLVTKTCDTQ
jgi:hypothetical protein